MLRVRIAWAALTCMLLLSACQNISPRSVRDSEQGRSPATQNRSDGARQGKPGSPPGVGETGIGASSEAEEARILAQRERAAGDGVAIFSVGAAEGSGLDTGASLAFQFVAAGTGERGVIEVALDCQSAPCTERSVTIAGEATLTRNVVMVLALTPGRWVLQAVQLSTPSTLWRTEKTKQVLARTPAFEVKPGYATYVGAFAVLGARSVADTASGTRPSKAGLSLVRYADVENDMTRALSEFPEARGRRLINTMRGINRPVLLE